MPFEILRWHARDPSSLFSAARAHSRLRQAAAAASTKCVVRSQSHKSTHPKVNSLLLYLSSHGQHVSSLDVRHPSGWKRVSLQELPPVCQLDSLCLENMSVQLYPANNRHGVLEALRGLTQLQLLECCLLDADGSAGALQQLRQLQHLKVVRMRRKAKNGYHNATFVLSNNMLQQLQGLTYLELHGCDLGSSPEPLPLLSNLQSLRLRDFELSLRRTEQLLAGMQHLTMLEMQSSFPFTYFPAGVLTGMSQLQHLDLSDYSTAEDATAVGDFLRELEHLTQLTHLSLPSVLNGMAYPAAAAYAALTASSKLQLLQLDNCELPPGAWQHMMPSGKPLLHLEDIQVNYCPAMNAADVAGLVSCCPNLQRLDLAPLHGDPVLVLAPLRNLTGLQMLAVPGESMNDAAVKQLAWLTALEELNISCDGPNSVTGAGLLHLTALRQLQRLDTTDTRPHPDYPTGYVSSNWFRTNNYVTEPPEVPVWKQLLQWCINRKVPGAVQISC